MDGKQADASGLLWFAMSVLLLLQTGRVSCFFPVPSSWRFPCFVRPVCSLITGRYGDAKMVCYG